VLVPLGKSEYCVLSWLVDCDMRRVLMTHIGFVQMVLLAPAMMDDQKLTTKPFSAQSPVSIRAPPNRFPRPTVVLAQEQLRLIVDRKPHCPRRQVSHYDGA